MSESWCCCCCDEDEDKQSLNPRRNNQKIKTVTTQPTSAHNYLSEFNELQETTEIESSKSEQISLLQATIDNQIQRHQEEVNRYQTKVKKLEGENNELLSRISAIASSKLTDNNPNIADLSDVNRPTKLSEQFSELYDNEWTDAIDVLTKKEVDGITEEKACKTLLQVVTKIYSTCHKKANDDLKQIEKMISTFNGTLKDDRKKNYTYILKQVGKDCDSSLKDLIPDEDASLMAKFIEKSVSVCWLMAIQDPPVFMDVRIELHGEPLSTDIYKHYTESGKTIDYLVWPVLYLHQGGSVLNKGIAQGMKDHVVTHL